MAAIQQWWFGLNRQRAVVVVPPGDTPWEQEGLADLGPVLFYDTFATDGVIDGQSPNIPADAVWSDQSPVSQSASGGALQITPSTYSEIPLSEPLPACSEINCVFGTTALTGHHAPQLNVAIGGFAFNFGLLGGLGGDKTTFLYWNDDYFMQTVVPDGPFVCRLRIQPTQAELYVNGVLVASEPISFPSTLFNGSGDLDAVQVFCGTADNPSAMTFAIVGYVASESPPNSIMRVVRDSLEYAAQYATDFPGCTSWAGSGVVDASAGLGVVGVGSVQTVTWEPSGIGSTIDAGRSISSGVFAFEVIVDAIPTDATLSAGIWGYGFGPSPDPDDFNLGWPSLGSYWQSNGIAGGYGGSTSIDTYASGDVLGFVSSDGLMHYYKNGEYTGVSSNIANTSNSGMFVSALP